MWGPPKMSSLLKIVPTLLVDIGTQHWANVTHTHKLTRSDEFLLATSVLSSNVLIMIWFVCNYKHSKMPISKSFMEFRPMGIQACFWNRLPVPTASTPSPHPSARTRSYKHTPAHLTSKEVLSFVCVCACACMLSAWLLYAPLRAFAQRCKVNASCLWTSWWVVPWAHLLLSPGQLLLHHLFFFFFFLLHTSGAPILQSRRSARKKSDTPGTTNQINQLYIKWNILEPSGR